MNYKNASWVEFRIKNDFCIGIHGKTQYNLSKDALMIFEDSGFQRLRHVLWIWISIRRLKIVYELTLTFYLFYKKINQKSYPN